MMDIERRYTADQRRAPTRPLSRYTLRGRRKKARRKGEDANYYVDRYESRYFVLIGLILVMCALDAYFTLKIVDVGGTGLKQLMPVFINMKPVTALVLKYLAVALGIVFILIHKTFKVFGRIRVSTLIYVFFSVYLTMIAYEAVLYFNHAGARSF
jgi:hypothetical protein